MSDAAPPPSGAGWTYAAGVYTISNGVNVTVRGDNQSPAPSQRRLAVAGSATVTLTLDNVSITDLGSGQTPLLLGIGANVTLILVEGTTNTFTSGFNAAGIRTTGTTLTINGTGSLQAAGTGGAGIGGSRGEAGGTLTINSGTIKANGGAGGAGIGGGFFGAGGAVTISGGT
ncbi:MAG: hypothetical protein LBP94_01255, partial [Zoogloeaceae bacterium]|nr:hypothetical protein [Zoogloeaceae bacterium]